MAVGKEEILASVLPSRLQFLRLNLKRSRTDPLIQPSLLLCPRTTGSFREVRFGGTITL